MEIPSSRSVSPAVDGVDRASVGAIPGAGEGGQGANGSESGATTTDPDSSDRGRTGSNGGPAGGTTDPGGVTKPSGGQTTPDRSAAPEVPTAVPAIALGADTLTGADVQWSLPIKGNPHLLIAELPGMGKTTCLLNLCLQMVNAARCGTSSPPSSRSWAICNARASGLRLSASTRWTEDAGNNARTARVSVAGQRPRRVST